MHYDREFLFNRDRTFWFYLMFAGWVVFYWHAKYFYEEGRYMQWFRKEKLIDEPAHHYSNRGGVLFAKQFIGFEKYYTNDESLMNWYKKTYPHVFTEEAEA